MAYIFYNPNPANRVAGDCTIRAISKITRDSWDDTYLDIALKGFIVKDMMSANYTWERYLHDIGFEKTLLPQCPYCYTVRAFCYDHPYGEYILGTGSHVVAVIDGNYYDAWDSGNEIPLYYWKRKET